MAVYLAFPVVTTAILALLWPHVSKTVIVLLATMTSAMAYSFLHAPAWGLHSTAASLGLMFALVVYSWFSVATVIAVRAPQSLRATSPPAASN